MRVIVVSEQSEIRQELVGALACDHRDVIGVDLERAPSELRRGLPEVLIVVVPAAGGCELIRALCAADPKGAMYVVAVLAADLSARAVASAIAAGSHDVLCAPYSTEELRARVDVQRRLRRWMSQHAMPAVTCDTVRSALTQLRAWEYLGDVVIDDLETMLGRSVELKEGWLAVTESSQLATISMTLPSEQLELCVSIVADTETRRWLGATLLGDAAAADEVLDDIMRELANVAGGSLKRAALAEGPVLSTGIPVDGRSLPRRDSGARCWTIALEGNARIGLVGEVRRRANRRIPASRLAEGMIVVDDVRNQAGILLLPSGTRLTSTTAQRLGNMLDLTIIEVSA